MHDHGSLYMEMNQLATELRSKPMFDESEWLQFAAKVDDLLSEVKRCASPLRDRSKGPTQTADHPYSEHAKRALPALEEGQMRIEEKSSRPASEALGRASLLWRGGGPKLP